jgi:hypothetical protein
LSLNAHDLGVTGVHVEISRDETLVRVQVHGILLHRADPAAEISKRLKLRLDNVPFAPEKVRIVPEAINDVLVWEGRRVGTAETVAMDAPVFPEYPAEKTLVTVVRNGKPYGETVLNADSGPVAVGETLGQALTRFIPIGIEHIWLGPDHIAFLIALLLPGGRFKALLAVITGFTIAHSVTLALAVLRVVTPVGWLVEGIIALSIVAAAGENLLAKGETRVNVRAIYAAGFGLVHGFGFAGALSEVGLPGHALGWALAGFNVGVEVGQLAIVGLVVPVLKRFRAHRKPIVKIGSLFIMAAGLYWTVERLFLR